MGLRGFSRWVVLPHFTEAEIEAQEHSASLMVSTVGQRAKMQTQSAPPSPLPSCTIMRQKAPERINSLNSAFFSSEFI